MLKNNFFFKTHKQSVFFSPKKTSYGQEQRDISWLLFEEGPAGPLVEVAGDLMPRAAYDQSYDWFLSLTDKSNISQYRCSDRRRKTLTTRLLSPLWELAANYIPPTVAPNVITLAGFMCNLQVSLLVALIR